MMLRKFNIYILHHDRPFVNAIAAERSAQKISYTCSQIYSSDSARVYATYFSVSVSLPQA